jgi:hypothetical protein
LIDPSRKNDGISIDDFLEISITQDSDYYNENRITSLIDEPRDFGDIRIYPKSELVEDWEDVEEVYQALLSSIDYRFITMDTFAGKSNPDFIQHYAFDKGPKFVITTYFANSWRPYNTEAEWSFNEQN